MTWTIYDTTTLRILGTVSGNIEPPVPVGAALLVGVSGDGTKERVKADLSGVEPLPEIEVTVSTLSPAADASVTVTCSPAVYVRFEGDHVGRLPAGGGTLRFEAEGAHDVEFVPAGGGSPGLPARRTFVVAPSAGAPAPVDLVVGEAKGAMVSDVRNRLVGLKAAINDCATRSAEAEAVRTAPITSIAEARTAIRELARIVRVSEDERAAELRHIRRAIFAFAEIETRR